MKQIIIYDENYNNNKIIIEYADHSFTEEDVKHLVLKYYKQQTDERAKKVEELYERLFNVCKEYKHTSIGLSDDSEFLNVMSELEEKTHE